MALRSIPRYDSDRVSRRGGRAVVVGASMAGLMAARVLADSFESVRVIDRDPLPSEPTARPGTPQAHHVHVLQEAGRATLEDLFPGFGEDLLAAGALMIDSASQFHFYDEGDFLADGPNRMPMYCASRPLFDHITRQHVAALDGVTLRGDCRFTRYLLDDRTSAVEGVAVDGAAVDGAAVDGAADDGVADDGVADDGAAVDGGDSEPREIAADVVVDATGRTSRTPTWLESHGYRSPETDEVHIDLAYSTVLVDRPPDDRRAFLALPTPPRTRGGVVIPVEDGRWLVTIAGVHGDHPPTDAEGFVDFAASLPISRFRDLLDDHEIVSEDVFHYPFQSTVRRRYEDLDRFPAGLVVVGDAIASFNPVYGQGMSVAALEALQLHHTLASGDRTDLGLRFFQRAGTVIDDAWNLAASADFQYPQTTGPEPFGTGILNRYLSRLTRKAHTDGVLAEAFARVIMMEKRPISLFRPDIVWRVLKPKV